MRENALLSVVFYERETGETFVFFERDFKHKSIRPPLFRLARESVVIAVEQIFLQGILHFLCCVSNLSLIFACFPFISRAAKGDNNRLTAGRREQEEKATKPTLIPPRRKEGTKKIRQPTPKADREKGRRRVTVNFSSSSPLYPAIEEERSEETLLGGISFFFKKKKTVCGKVRAVVVLRIRKRISNKKV